MMDSTERSFANMRASTDGSSGVPSGSGLSSASRKSVSCVDLTPPDVRSKLGSNEFIVERVMSYKQIHKIRYARVKWLGYAETTWEPADQIFYYQPQKKTREAESLVGRRLKKGKYVDYKVHWKGLPSSSDSWVRETTLGRPDLVHAYLQEHTLEKPKSAIQPLPRKKRKFTKNSKLDAILQSQRRTESKTLVHPEIPTRGSGNAGAIPMYMAGLSVDSIALQRLQSDTEANLKNSFATASVNPGGIPGPLPLKTEAKPEPSPAPSSSILTEIPRIEVQKPISEWTVSDVSDFLTQKGFTDAANKLCQRNIDGKELLNSLDPAAMRKLEIPVGHSLKIVKLISEMRMPGPL